MPVVVEEEEEDKQEGQAVPTVKEPDNPHADLEDMETMQLRNVLMNIVVRLRHMTHANTMQERKIRYVTCSHQYIRKSYDLISLFEECEFYTLSARQFFLIL